MVSQDILNKYREKADEFISDLGISCRVIYPPIKNEQCNNCTTITSGGEKLNIYRSGGPKPFNGVKCPLCGGQQLKETESPIENVTLRIDYKFEEWAKIKGIVVPEGSIRVIGHIADLPKIRKSQKIIINQEISGIGVYEYVLDGDPIPHGLGGRNYFMATLVRI